MTWDEQFTALFAKSVDRYTQGDTNWQAWFDAADLAFLASIGCQTREFFDFIEDRVDADSWQVSTVLLIAAVRRDFFLTIQKGKLAEGPLVTTADLPTFGDEIEGYFYLPRLLAKARAKLAGTLDPDIMFGCGGDRKFLLEHNLHPADFLRVVWAARDDDSRVIAWIKSRAN